MYGRAVQRTETHGVYEFADKTVGMEHERGTGNLKYSALFRGKRRLLNRRGYKEILWSLVSMEFTVSVPDEFAVPLIPPGQETSRAALEALALEAYRQRRMPLCDGVKTGETPWNRRLSSINTWRISLIRPILACKRAAGVATSVFHPGMEHLLNQPARIAGPSAESPAGQRRKR